MMRTHTVAMLAFTLAVAGACNRQDSGAVGTNPADMPVDTAGSPARSETGSAGYSMPGQTPSYGQPGGAPSMVVVTPDGVGPSSAESGGGALAD